MENSVIVVRKGIVTEKNKNTDINNTKQNKNGSFFTLGYIFILKSPFDEPNETEDESNFGSTVGHYVHRKRTGTETRL